MCLHYKSFENIVGKGGIASYEQISPFSYNVFYLFGEFSSIFIKS